jgi:nicotinamidase/pyrazinamidase
MGPAPVLYDEATALVVVDVQRDFADPSGGLYVPGGEEVVAPINAEAARAHAAGATVVVTQDWHPPDTPHFAKDGGTWPVHCVAGTWGAELHPDLEVDAEVTIRKGAGGEDGYSGFTVRDPVTGQTSPTGLEAALRERGVTKVVVVGIATDVCVFETARDALELGFDTTVLVHATRPVERQPGDGQRALARLEALGAHLG